MLPPQEIAVGIDEGDLQWVVGTVIRVNRQQSFFHEAHKSGDKNQNGTRYKWQFSSSLM